MSNSGGISQKLIYGVSVGLGVSMISAASYWIYKNFRRDVMPTRWRRIGILAQVNLFPVKSCAPLSLTADAALQCEVLGLRIGAIRDRALMLVDESMKMVTARTYPKMVLIKPVLIASKKLLISAPEMDSLELDLSTLANESCGKDISTDVWGIHLDAMLCGEKYDKWFSEAILGKESGLRLVYYPYPMPVRAINPRLTKEPYMTKEDTGAFGDATSYMLMNLASVDELNTRIVNAVNPLQFRGNFHLKMDIDKPYSEDTWKWLKIGDNAVFRSVGPCTRCIFPNIHVDTGERDPDFEPQSTLQKYRIFKGYESPGLGILLGLRRPGVVQVNDVIYVEDE